LEFLAVIVLFPLLLGLLSLGCGFLVERCTGARLPALLLLPLGFGGLVAVSQFTTWTTPTAPWTPWILLLLALAGFALQRGEIAERWRARGRGWWWWPAAAVATYAIVAAPEIVAERVTFTGFLLDTTGAIQISGAERLLHHGHDFSGGLLPGYGWALARYFGTGYPSGGQGALAAVGWLSGQDLIWLYSPFQAAELAITALGLAFLARTAGLRRPYAAIAGVIAAVPALVYAYALMGSIKELTALPMLVLLGALIPCARRMRSRAGWRAALPFGVAAAAALDAVGIAASVWVALFGLAALLASAPLAGARYLPRTAAGGAWLAVTTAVVALPTVGPLSKALSEAESVTNANSHAVSDPGNLVRPLKFIQALGIWLGESHRVEPRFVNQTYLLVGIVVVCMALGSIWLVRRRAWGVIAFVAVSFTTWAILHSRGTTWTDAKILMLLSPVAVLLALMGAFGLMQRSRWEGAALALAVVGGILSSDALLYHGTNLAPAARYQELKAIDARFAGLSPTLTPEFDEYSVYLLRNMGPDGPGLAYSAPFLYVGGASYGYSHSYDLDQLALSSVESYRVIVMRRSPAQSRPPGNFREVWSGRYYTAWLRDAPPPRAHFPLGAGFTPSATPSCHEVREIARQARRAGLRIAYVPRQLNVSANLAAAYHSSNIGAGVDLEGRLQYMFGGPGRVVGKLRLKSPGRYELWLSGSVDRPMHVLIDGRAVGAVSQESGDDGNVIHVADLSLSAGEHGYELVRGGGDLRPDDNGGAVIDGFVLQPMGMTDPPVRTIAASRWRSLCERPLDWIETGQD
jgi:hypothetical protein